MKVSIIIPAYNEELLIARVIKKLLPNKSSYEIICVNDGSTDNTLEILKKFKKDIRIIDLPRNHGKGNAIAKGITKAQGDIVVFIDADITGLKKKHIDALVLPLLGKKADVTIGCFTRIKTDHFFKPLMGQRAYWKKDLLPYLSEMKTKGYGLELYLNNIFKNKKALVFPLEGTGNMLKHNKQPYDTAAKLFVVELLDITSEILRQNDPFSKTIENYFFSQKKSPYEQIKKLSRYIKKNVINNIFS